jgi:hypothetical protein
MFMITPIRKVVDIYGKENLENFHCALRVGAISTL